MHSPWLHSRRVAWRGLRARVRKSTLYDLDVFVGDPTERIYPVPMCLLARAAAARLRKDLLDARADRAAHLGANRTTLSCSAGEVHADAVWEITDLKRLAQICEGIVRHIEGD